MASSPQSSSEAASESPEREASPNNLNWDDSHEITAYPEALEDAGLTCELRRFDSLINSQGDRIILPIGCTQAITRNWNRPISSALVLTKIWNNERQLNHTELEIRSPFMKGALQSVVPDLKEFPINARHIVLQNEPACIFHYQQELEDYGNTHQDPQAAKHILFLLEYMREALSTDLIKYSSAMNAPAGPLFLDYNTLWMAFKLGDLVLIAHPVTYQEQIIRFKSMDRCRCERKHCVFDYWTILGDIFSFNGDPAAFPPTHIKRFDGYRQLQDLPAFPLRYHPDEEGIRARHLARARKQYLRPQGIDLRQYEGVTSMHPSDEQPVRSSYVNGRIIIDSVSYHRATGRQTAQSVQKRVDQNKEGQLNVMEEDYIIYPHSLPGYSLNNRQWGLFYVDCIKDIQFNDSAFESLILIERDKKRILSLLRAHGDERLAFDDFIGGKGKGKIFLLHGEPGVGKTLTVESVADYCKKPLIRLDANYLGTTSQSVEKSLKAILPFAERWKAIVLLDEADVYLQQRQKGNSEQSSLVSVVIRMLESYEGILFLTTNQIHSLDRAFKSRIHLAIHYPKLTRSSRRRLWHMLLSRASSDSIETLVADGTLDEMAEEELNGHQIKNLVSTAYALAFSDRSLIKRHHILDALEPMKDFDRNFDRAIEENRARETGEVEDVTGRPPKRRRIEDEGAAY
ncbi:Fc.00g084130.m01.CDS01 [Cosmosporella sp. VM-42]